MDATKDGTGDTDSKIRLGFSWVIGNIAGWLIGIGGALGIGMQVTDSLTGGSPTPNTTNYSGLVGVVAAFLLALLLSAIMVSLAQWMVIRCEIAKGWIWLITTFFGILIGLSAAVTIGETITGWIVFGGIVGTLQWLVLRVKVHRAGNWILINVLAGLIGGSVGWVLARFFESRAIVSTIGVMFSSVLAPPIVASVITGFGLVWVLQQEPRIPDFAKDVDTSARKSPEPTSPALSPSQPVDREEATDWLEDLLDEEK